MFVSDGQRAARGLTDVSRHNRAMILRTVQQRGSASRAEVAQATGLSKAATSVLVDALLRDGRLLEASEAEGLGAAKTSRGRRLIINRHYGLAVGLELTNDGRVRGVLVDATGTVLHTLDGAFDAALGPEPAADGLAQAFAKLTADHRLAALGQSASEVSAPSPTDQPAVRAVGVAVPGTVDVPTGIVRWLPTAQNWFDVPLQALVEQRVGIPTVVDWRAYAATVAELRYGSARGIEQAICLYLGEGIGMGIINGDALLRGASNQAGSLAHLAVADDGPICHCGMRGCLWAVASTTAILRRVREGVDAGVLSRVSSSIPCLTLSEVFAAARHGDRLCADVLRDAGQFIGRAIAMTAHIVNPQVAIVEGPLAEGADLLAEPIRRTLRDATFPWMQIVPEVRFSDLGLLGAARGSAATALDLVLDLA